MASAEGMTLEIEDEWLDFTADLLALKEYEPIVQSLFNHPVGQWSDLANLLEEHAPIAQALERLQEECNTTLSVTWLAHPELDRGYCLVLFYVDSLDWNHLALYNKQRLETVTTGAV